MSRYEVTIQETRVIKIGVIAGSLDAATELAGAALDDSEYSKHAELVELIEAQILAIKEAPKEGATDARK
mgnify:CR=1 FL=1